MIERAAEFWRRQGRRSILIEQGLRLFGMAGLALTLALWADDRFELSHFIRLGLWILAVAVLGRRLYRISRLWIFLDEPAAVSAAERALPELGGRLKTAWELSRSGVLPGLSPELARAHIEETERLLAPLVSERSVFPTSASFSASGFALAGLAAVLALFPLGAKPCWQRMLFPFGDWPLERLIEIRPGDATGELGLPAQVEARWSASSSLARDRQDLKLFVRGASGWRSAEWDLLGAGAALFSISSLNEPLTYRLEWKDLKSRTYRLIPALSPRLGSLRATISGNPPQTVLLDAGRSIDALRGSWISIDGRPNQPLKQASLKLSSSMTPIEMQRLKNGEYEAGFVASADAELQFDLKTEDGRGDSHPAVYSIRVLADRPPEAELLSPLDELSASPSDTIPVSWAARDDGGVSRIALVVRLPGPAREIEIARPAGAREASGDFLWNLADLPLGEIRFQIKAYDGSGQTGLSSEGKITLADFDRLHREMETQWLKSEAAIEALMREEAVALELAQSSEAAKLAGLSEKLESGWEKGNQALSSLALQMAGDRMSNPGLADEMRSFSDELSRLRQKDLAAAQRSAQSGDFSSAAKSHEKLGKRLAAVRAAMKEGHNLQGLGDFYGNSQRMSAEAAALQSSLLSASARKPSSAEAAALEKAMTQLKRQLEAFERLLSSLPKAQPGSSSGSGQRALSLPMNEARDSAEALMNALMKGDYAEAARLAEELSSELADMQRRIAEAAESQARSGPASAQNEAFNELRRKWGEAIESQTKALELAQRAEDERLKSKMKSEQDLLRSLGDRQQALISSAAARSDFPQEALSAMRRSQEEFSQGRITRAPQDLQTASSVLHARAKNDPSLSQCAGAQDSLRSQLEGAVAEPQTPTGPAAEAAQGQSEASSKASEVGGQLQALDAEVDIPGEAFDNLSKAQAQQSKASESLARQDSASAVSREQSALDFLNRADQALGSAGQKMGAAASSAGKHFSQGRGGSGGSGAQGVYGLKTDPVPLPSARDYRPPREMREELEESLRESRPQAYDELIKEYFKRVAQ